MPRVWAIWVCDCPLSLRTDSVTISSGLSLGAMSVPSGVVGTNHDQRAGPGPRIHTKQPVSARNTSCPLTPIMTGPPTSAGYDSRNQLTDFRRGPLSDTNTDNIPDTVSTASATAGWTYDEQGNM